MNWDTALVLNILNVKHLFIRTLHGTESFVSLSFSTLSTISTSPFPLFLWLLYTIPLALMCATPDVFAAPAAETAAAAEGGAVATNPTPAADGTAPTGG